MWCLFVLLLWNCNNFPDNQQLIEIDETVQTFKDSLQILDFEGLKPLLNKTDNTIYVVNFWATWCAPCIKELPAFEKIGRDFASENVKVLLVSLDFPHQYNSKLKPFIAKHNLQSEILVLNDTDGNTWIPQVNADWSGAIPATLIYSNDKRQFYEQTFTYETLQTEVEQFLNK